jgi:hypothetical protein
MHAQALESAVGSVKTKWIVCLVCTGAFLGLALLGKEPLPIGLLVVGLLFALVGFVYSLSVLFAQMRAIRAMNAAGVSANIWYVGVVLGLVFLIPGILVETAIFLAAAYRVLSRLKGHEQQLPGQIPLKS